MTDPAATAGATPASSVWTLSRNRFVAAPPERVFETVERLGGGEGYRFADVAWTVRGWIDRALGGRGIERSRRCVDARRVGERFDFWVVEARRPPQALRLRADLRMPGRGWLEFDVAPEADGCRLTLTASFVPHGPAGGVYWFALYPIHDFVFRGMLRALARPGAALAAAPRDTGPFPPVASPASAPCGHACPAGNDVRGWVAVIAQRERLGISEDEAYARAFRILAETNPFPATTGRVCPHPCEDGCNRRPKDGAVAVHALERFLGDRALERGMPLPRDGWEPRAESVGVIGSGPAGLSFAYQMARRGYPVTVYERAPAAGGMLRWGIPRYRLPEAVLDAEIARISELGVSFVFGAGGGRGAALAEVEGRHDAVFLAIGAQRSRGLGVAGETLPGVCSGTEYLRRVHEGAAPELGGRVVVVGGGNTAIDAARVARRRGAAVEIVYRRGREDMPAIASEIDEAVGEGVALETWVAPTSIESRAGGGLRVRLQRMRPGDPDGSGRARPVPVPGESLEREADAVIAAVAQEPDWAGAEDLAVDGWARPGPDGSVDRRVWAGGDVVRPGIVSEAIGFGRRAAESAHARLRGRTAPRPPDRGVADRGVRIDLYEPAARVSGRSIPPAEALARPDAEVREGITADEFLAETARCLSCGRCFGCERCWTFCVHGGFVRRSDPEPGAYFDVDLADCRGCGKCADVCPCGFLQIRAPAGDAGN